MRHGRSGQLLRRACLLSVDELQHSDQLPDVIGHRENEHGAREVRVHFVERGIDGVFGAGRKAVRVIDDERHDAIAKKLAIQERDAIVWRDACLLYFQTFAKRPLPAGVEKPAKTLEEYKAKSLLDH